MNANPKDSKRATLRKLEAEEHVRDERNLRRVMYFIKGIVVAAIVAALASTFWHYVIVGARPEDTPMGDYVLPVSAVGTFVVGSMAWPLFFYWIDRRKEQ
jgi:hypothetical protein